jgi:putative phosphoesterase
MRLGIISDTHGMLRPGVFSVFAEVDHIIHAGDVGPAELLDELAALAPVAAVYGNTDGFDVRSRTEKVVHLDLEGLRLTVTHGDQFGTPSPDILAREFPDRDVLVYGHTHEARLEFVDETLTVVNPGPAGATRGSTRPSVCVMEYEPVLPPRARIVEVI